MSRQFSLVAVKGDAFSAHTSLEAASLVSTHTLELFLEFSKRGGWLTAVYAIRQQSDRAAATTGTCELAVQRMPGRDSANFVQLGMSHMERTEEVLVDIYQRFQMIM